jgi:SAM-dependent methyltransferase
MCLNRGRVRKEAPIPDRFFDDATLYGRHWADVFDTYAGTRGLDPAPAVAFLAALAGDGPVLELGIGSGRVALPLRAAGVDVHGIDASEEMVALLRAKPDGDGIPVTIGDYTCFELTERFTLVYGVYNAVLLPTTRDAQHACFEHVAKHLLPGGRFVIEAEVPDLTGFPRGGMIHVAGMTEDSVELRVTRHLPADQVLVAQHIWISKDGIRLRPGAVRYAAPPELDLMASAAGLTLEDRYTSWNRQPFGNGSGTHVSVYRK